MTSPPGIRVSTRSACPCPTTRKPQVRLSCPQASVVGAQLPAAYRLYELIVGAKKIASSFAHAICPARNRPEERRRGVTAGEGVAAVAPEACVDVARVADPRLERLRHEADRAAVQERDLLGAVLVDHVVVGHRQGVREPEVDLLLARPRLALRGLDPDPCRLHVVPDRAEQRLVVRRGEDVVVEDVRDGRRQALIALRVRVRVCLACTR